MRHLTKTNKHFLLVGLTFLATSFTLGVVTYILLGLKMITDTLKTSSHP